MKRLSRLLLTPAGLILLAIFLLAPVLALLTRVELAVLTEVVQKSNFEKILTSTLVSAVGGALGSVILGLFFARYFALHDWRGKRLQRLLLLIPFLVPNFVLATAYVVAWNPGTGLLNSVLKFPFGLYGIWGMSVIFAVVHGPVAFLMFEEKIARIDASLREAAQLSGAGAWTIFRRIELPLLLPSFFAALVLSFVLNIAAFAIPAWIGAPERAYTLSYKIYQSIQLGGAEGFPQAASYALVLISIVLPTLIVLSFVERSDQRFAVVSGKGSRKKVERPAFASLIPFQILFWCSQIILWLAPLAVLFSSTLVPPGCLQSDGLKCLSTPSLQAYRYVLFELPETSEALQGSFIYGSLSAVLVSIACVLILVLLARSKSGLKIAEWMIVLASATPGAILALGVIIIYSGRFHVNLYNTAWIVVVAFIVKHMSLAFQPLRTGLAGIAGSLTEAGRMSGATSAQIWTRITLPILKPDLVGGFFLVLVPILGELTMSVFLVSPNYRSIGTLLFDLQDYADQGSAAALSMILVAAVLLLNEAARLLSKGRFGY